MTNDQLSKEELGKLLTATLPTNADRSELHSFVRGQQKLISYLAHALARQSLSILELRETQVSHKDAIEHVADLAVGMDDERPSSLVGFEEPKVII